MDELRHRNHRPRFDSGDAWQATGAKRAASEAREAVQKQEASHAISELIQIAGELAILPLAEHPKEGAVRARDLAARIARDRARFERFLEADSDKLKALEPTFQRLGVELSSARFAGESDQAAEAIQSAFEAMGELNAVYGRLLARLDEEQP